jgi:hypothetical protein
MRRGLRTSRIWIALLGLYALVLLASPALHCDFACHQKEPTHCQVCLVGPVAAPTIAQPSVWIGTLPLAGEVLAQQFAPQPRTVEVDVPGRAPPA